MVIADGEGGGGVADVVVRSKLVEPGLSAFQLRSFGRLWLDAAQDLCGRESYNADMSFKQGESKI